MDTVNIVFAGIFSLFVVIGLILNSNYKAFTNICSILVVSIYCVYIEMYITSITIFLSLIFSEYIISKIKVKNVLSNNYKKETRIFGIVSSVFCMTILALKMKNKFLIGEYQGLDYSKIVIGIVVVFSFLILTSGNKKKWN